MAKKIRRLRDFTEALKMQQPAIAAVEAIILARGDPANALAVLANSRNSLSLRVDACNLVKVAARRVEQTLMPFKANP